MRQSPCGASVWVRRAAAIVQLGRIGLHPAPNTARVHFDTKFGRQLGDVLVGERIPEIPAQILRVARN
jgi:hypothetical protein